MVIFNPACYFTGIDYILFFVTSKWMVLGINIPDHYVMIQGRTRHAIYSQFNHMYLGNIF